MVSEALRRCSAKAAIAFGWTLFSGSSTLTNLARVSPNKAVIRESIRSVPLDDVRSLVLDDKKLQDELNRALAALAGARDQDKKPVTINFAGTGNRRVRIGYVVETPIWKTSYRLAIK